MAQVAGEAQTPRGPGIGWSAELKAYETARRREVDPRLLRGSAVNLNNGYAARAERAFDPLLQRFRDEGREQELRSLEDQVRLGHLNRAMDIQLRREQHHNVVTHEGRLEPLRPQGDEATSSRRAGATARFAMPRAEEYNIVSNLPLDVHHWARPEERPPPPHREGKPRQVPTCTLKDWNVLTNRYLSDHEVKDERDRTLNLLEASQKFRKRSLFDPVLQRFREPEAEERARALDDARDMENTLRRQAKLPLTHSGCVQAGYDLVTHQARDPGLLELLDTAELERSARFQTRYKVERDTREKDISFEDMAIAQKKALISHHRFEETADRGFDIITNAEFGEGPKRKHLWMPATTPHPTVWEKVMSDRATVGPMVPAAGSEAGNAAPGPADLGPSARALATPRQATPRRLAEVGSVAVASSVRSASDRGSVVSSRQPASARAKLSRPDAASAPPAPAIPGSPNGSVFSRSRV